MGKKLKILLWQLIKDIIILLYWSLHSEKSKDSKWGGIYRFIVDEWYAPHPSPPPCDHKVTVSYWRWMQTPCGCVSHPQPRSPPLSAARTQMIITGSIRVPHCANNMGDKKIVRRKTLSKSRVEGKVLHPAVLVPSSHKLHNTRTLLCLILPKARCWKMFVILSEIQAHLPPFCYGFLTLNHKRKTIQKETEIYLQVKSNQTIYLDIFMAYFLAWNIATLAKQHLNLDDLLTWN